jgi:hypothetical protein
MKSIHNTVSYSSGDRVQDSGAIHGSLRAWMHRCPRVEQNAGSMDMHVGSGDPGIIVEGHGSMCLDADGQNPLPRVCDSSIDRARLRPRAPFSVMVVLMAFDRLQSSWAPGYQQIILVLLVPRDRYLQWKRAHRSD